MVGNQTTFSSVSRWGSHPLDFFIQLILPPTLSTAVHFLADSSCHRLHFPFEQSQPGTDIPVTAMIPFSLCLKLSIHCLSKRINEISI